MTTRRAPSYRATLRSAAFALAPRSGRPTALVAGEAPPLPSAPRLLLVRPDHLGDVLFAGPAACRLRAAWPEAHVTMLVGPWAAELAERLPDIDSVAVLAFPWFDRLPKRAPWDPYLRLVRSVRMLRHAAWWPPDAAVVLRDDDYWGAWLTALAGVPIRFGHDDPTTGRFLTHVLPAEECPEHVAAASIALVEAMAGVPVPNRTGVVGPPPAPGVPHPPLRLRVTTGDVDRARRLVMEHEVVRRYRAQGPGAAPSWRPVAVHPGSGATIKRWRPGGWREVLDAVLAPGEPVFVTGGAHEAALAHALATVAGRPVADLTGLTDLGSLAALFAECRLVMGPDSGPLHLAVAVGTPTLHLFGPADARRFGPWGPSRHHVVVRSDLPCAPCGRLDWPSAADHPCVRGIDVPAVLAAARSSGALD